MENPENKPKISEDLKEIVSTTIDSIKEGMKGRDCGVAGYIEFEIAVVKSKEARGGLRFIVADASGNYTSESVSRIKFKIIGSKTDFGSRLTDLWLHK